VSEERARMISELTADYAYVYRLQPDGTIVREWTTSSFTRMNRAAPEELDAYDWESAVHPADRSLIAARVAVVRAGNPDVREWRVLTRSGEVRWLRDSCRPIIDQECDRPIRIYGAAQDITERKETEQQKDDLTSIAAHELRNPIAIVLGFAQTLLVQTARGKGPQLAAWQEKALASVFRPGRLVHASGERDTLASSSTVIELFAHNISFTTDCDWFVIARTIPSTESMVR